MGEERQMAGSFLPDQSACPRFSSPPAVPSLFPASSPRESAAVLGSGVGATDHQERTLYAERDSPDLRQQCPWCPGGAVVCAAVRFLLQKGNK